MSDSKIKYLIIKLLILFHMIRKVYSIDIEMLVPICMPFKVFFSFLFFPIKKKKISFFSSLLFLYLSLSLSVVMLCRPCAAMELTFRKILRKALLKKRMLLEINLRRMLR